jgi:hypothetical protein
LQPYLNNLTSDIDSTWERVRAMSNFIAGTIRRKYQRMCARIGCLSSKTFGGGGGFRQVIEELKQPYECECSAGHSQSGLLGIHHARRAQELLLTGLTLSVIQHFTVEREPVRVFRATARLGVAPRAQRPLLRPLRPKCISTIRTKRPQSASPEKLVTADVTRRARRV